MIVFLNQTHGRNTNSKYLLKLLIKKNIQILIVLKSVRHSPMTPTTHEQSNSNSTPDKLRLQLN